MTRAKKLNTTQLAALRQALNCGSGLIQSADCTLKALAARGYAAETPEGDFFITSFGRDRARRKADLVSPRDGVAFDPTLLEDLP